MITMNTQAPIRPTYYVRHPNGAFSIAMPQPTDDEIRAQKDFVYAQCTRSHGGDCCEDPRCWLNRGRTTGDLAP